MRLHSYLDGVADQALTGWIANLDRPQSLERVIVEGSHGARLEFTACLPRRDVCDAFSVTGRFGFAIPTACLRPLGPVVRVSDGQGRPIEGGECVTLPLPGQTRRSGQQRNGDPAWAMVHIQKTAGTSLRVAMAGMVRAGEAIFLYNDGFTGISVQELAAMPIQQRSLFRLVVGHEYVDAFTSLPRPLEYLTVLREPEARLRSHYYHHLGAGSVFHFGGAAADVAAVATHGLTDEFDNLMTRMLSGSRPEAVPLGGIDETHVALALHNLRTRFRFVALTERLDEQFPAMCRALGVRERTITHANQGRVAPSMALDAQVNWTRVMHRNRFDAMLYRRAQDEGLCGRDLMPPSYRTLALRAGRQQPDLLADLPSMAGRASLPA